MTEKTKFIMDLPHSMNQKLEATKKNMMISKCGIIRLALKEYFERCEDEDRRRKQILQENNIPKPY